MYTEEFANYLKANGLGKTHYNHLTHFFRYLKDYSIEPQVLSYDQIAKFINLRRDAGAEQGTINNYIKAIKMYSKFLVYVKNYPSELLDNIGKFKLKEPPKKIKQVLTLDEFTVLMGRLMQHCKPRKRLKILALFYFMFFTGLRRSSVINLKRTDIDLLKNMVIVRIPTKGNMEYPMYFPGEVGDYIRRYFKTEDEDINAFNMTEDTLYNLFAWANQYLPVDQHITPHTFRYSFGAMAMEGDVNLKLMQKMFGHKSIDSTLHYCDPSPKIVEKVYRQKFIYKPPVAPTEEPKQ